MPIKITDGRELLDYLLEQAPYAPIDGDGARLLRALRKMWRAVERGDQKGAEKAASEAANLKPNGAKP